jgi:hypothetical protein
MKRLVAILIIPCSIHSCRQTSEALYIKNQCNGTGSFIIDTPAKAQTCYRVKANNDFLGLKQIGNPSDTFFFRIHYGGKNAARFFEYTTCDSFQAFKLFVIPAERRGRLLFDKEKDRLDNYVTVFDPAKKGKDFVKQMAENRILELPQREQIKGYPDDEVFTSGCIIEYSSKCRYKVQLYNSPRTYSSEFIEAKRLMNFVDYLSKEFGF